MAKLRLLAALALVPIFAAVAGAGEPVTEKKRPVVSERTFDVPLDFKSRSDFYIGDPVSIPSGRAPNLSVESKNPFFGLGLAQPFGGTK
jgi:hypothetical protein